MKDLLTQLYVEAIKDATNYYLSYCCCSAEEEEERLKDDEEQIKYFINILKQI